MNMQDSLSVSLREGGTAHEDASETGVQESLEGYPRIAAEADGLAHALRGLLEAVAAGAADGLETEATTVQLPIPLSRASADDFLDIVRLWNEHCRNREWPARRDCPACTSKSHRYIFRSYDSYPFHACNDCGTWFVPHRIDSDFVETFLDEIPAAREISDRMMEGREVTTKPGDHARFGFYFDLLKPFLNGLPGQPRHLDIGCGVGHSLDVATTRGIDSVGLEVSHVACRTGRQNGRRIFHVDETIDGERFDVVSLFEALEHVSSPDEVVANVGDRLADDGLVMITVPNRSCWEISVLRERSLHVYGGADGVGHVNLFDQHSLGTLLKRHGFELGFVDGQFGSNLHLLVDGLVNPNRSPLDFLAEGEIALKVPNPLHWSLNSAGPTMAALDRIHGRSPIMVAVACRTAAKPRLQWVFDEMVRNRDEGVRDGLKAA